MPKKSFKQDIGELIEKSTAKSFFSDQTSVEDEDLKYLQYKMSLYLQELKLWRTGKLTMKKFQSSLTNHHLRYNPDTNDFEVIKH